MSSRVRVAKTIDEGYAFDVEHKNWVLELSWKEKILLFLTMFLPTFVINLTYILFRDILLSQMLFQLTLVIIPAIYNQFYPLNLDIIYIQYLKNVPEQIKQGIRWSIFYFLMIPGVATILKYFEIHILENMVFMIPSGLTPLSKFQRGFHIIYFALLIVVFGVIGPIAEFRYYLVFLQSKFKNDAYTSVFLYVILALNSLMVMLLISVYSNITFALMFLALILISNYRTLVVKSGNGIIFALLRQFGINFGFILLMILSIYSDHIIARRRDISLFIDKNAIDMMVNGFIWDDPNYDSSF